MNTLPWLLLESCNNGHQQKVTVLWLKYPCWINLPCCCLCDENSEFMRVHAFQNFTFQSYPRIQQNASSRAETPRISWNPSFMLLYCLEVLNFEKYSAVKNEIQRMKTVENTVDEFLSFHNKLNDLGCTWCVCYDNSKIVNFNGWLQSNLMWVKSWN